MKKFFISLILIFGFLFGHAQKYQYDSIGIFNSNNLNQSTSTQTTGTIEFYYRDAVEYVNVYFNKTQKAIEFKLDTLINKTTPRPSVYLMFYHARNNVEDVDYVASFRFVNNKLESVGFNDGDYLMIFLISKDPIEDIKTRL